MALMMNERLKHRLVGIVVIISIGTIFVPALMKTSTSKLEQKSTLAIKFPSKPPLPEVAIKSKEELFKTVKVAHVTIPIVNEPLALTKIAKAQPLSQMTDTKRIPISKSVIVKAPVIKTPSQKEEVKKVPVKEAAKKASKNIAQTESQLTTYNYAVQLATFSIQSNATTLVNKLKSKGYKATVSKSIVNKNVMYKVLVGNSPQKEQVILLKKQLAATMHLTGLIVSTTGIS